MFEAGAAVISQNLALVDADDAHHRGAAIVGFVLPRSRVAASRRARADLRDAETSYTDDQPSGFADGGTILKT
jgi:hypothetical protein